MSMSFVGAGAAAHFSASLTATPTYAGATGGNTLVVWCNHADFGNNHPDLSMSDGTGKSFVNIGSLKQGNVYISAIFVQENCNAGAHSVVITPSAGAPANSFGDAIIAEFSATAGTGGDKAVSATGTSTVPATGSTATLSTSDEAVFTSFLGAVNITGETDPPNTGFTTLFLQLTNAANLPSVFAYKIVAANTPQSANIGTLNASDTWIANLATISGAGATPSAFPIGQICT